MRRLLPTIALLFACSSPETPEGRPPAAAVSSGSGGAAAGSAGATSSAGAGGTVAGSAGALAAGQGQAGQSAGSAGVGGAAAGASGAASGGTDGGQAGAGGASSGSAGAACGAKLAAVDPQSQSCISQPLNALGQDAGWCESMCGGYTKIATCTTGHFPPVQCATLSGSPDTYCCKVAVCYAHQHACPAGGSPLNCAKGNYPADKKCTVPDPANPQEACCSPT